MNTDTSSIHQENKPGDSIYIPGKSQASINVRVSEVVQRGYRFKYDSSSGEYSDVLPVRTASVDARGIISSIAHHNLNQFTDFFVRTWSLTCCAPSCGGLVIIPVDLAVGCGRWKYSLKWWNKSNKTHSWTRVSFLIVNNFWPPTNQIKTPIWF